MPGEEVDSEKDLMSGSLSKPGDDISPGPHQNATTTTSCHLISLTMFVFSAFAYKKCCSYLQELTLSEGMFLYMSASINTMAFIKQRSSF